MKEVLISERFDDIYFSKEDGLAETQHVFLDGNNLPNAWAGRNRFTIFETGFGTGLNFFSVWKLFEETAQDKQHLDFISVEKYPLKTGEILQALDPWLSFFDGRIENFLKLYPIRIAGFHRIQVTNQITLTLIFDDINEALPQVQAQVDCWFLDGFTPAKNPEMWTNILYENMARLSVEGARYATFTAAGDVRRGLKAVGFSVEKQKGFGRKRDMMAGGYNGEKTSNQRTHHNKRAKKIAIIGGGLAGTSCAYMLKKYGFEPVIYEAGESLASGASGNELGLYNPRFSKLRDPMAQFYVSAYANFLTIAKQAGDRIENNSCGVLYLVNDEKRQDRFDSMIQNWGWSDDHMRLISADKASEIAGIEIQYDALYLPEAGSVHPRKLCEYYAKDIEVRFNNSITDVADIDADAVILCCGAEVAKFENLSWLTLNKTRGQLSVVKVNEASTSLKCAVNYGGYITPARNNIHIVGATFEKHIRHNDVTQESHEANIAELKANLFAQEKFDVDDGRAAYRVASPDHFPVIGAMPSHDNIYVCTALGSYGVVSSLMGAQIITDLLRGASQNVPSNVLKALSPQRFVDRASKKGAF